MTNKKEMMDEFEQKLKAALKSIPSGGGETGAYGRDISAGEAAKIIRAMIELAVLK